jgi:putative protease
LAELVLPGGDLEKLYTAVLFGADAVYLGGKEFSLRAYAANFDPGTMAEGVSWLHKNNKKAYITVNILAHNQDFARLPAYLEKLQELKVDALIISDLGVFRSARKYAPAIPITVSTQANVCNYEAAALYEELGARRVVLARELSLDEIAHICYKTQLEVEVFIHGAMCSSYSGRCMLSSFMTGRSANQGECAYPCRYRYRVMEEQRPGQWFSVTEDERGTYIFNSRDLCLLDNIPDLLAAGVKALKVEGRMKSPLYVACTAKVYRDALDCLKLEGIEEFINRKDLWQQELDRIASRPYTSGFISGQDTYMQDLKNSPPMSRTDFCGTVTAFNQEQKILYIRQRSPFGLNDDLELFTPSALLPITISELYDETGTPIEYARHPLQTVRIPYPFPVPEYSVLRRRAAFV